MRLLKEKNCVVVWLFVSGWSGDKDLAIAGVRVVLNPFPPLSVALV